MTSFRRIEEPAKGPFDFGGLDETFDNDKGDGSDGRLFGNPRICHVDDEGALSPFKGGLVMRRKLWRHKAQRVLFGDGARPFNGAGMSFLMMRMLSSERRP